MSSKPCYKNIHQYFSLVSLWHFLMNLIKFCIYYRYYNELRTNVCSSSNPFSRLVSCPEGIYWYQYVYHLHDPFNPITCVDFRIPYSVTLSCWWTPKSTTKICSLQWCSIRFKYLVGHLLSLFLLFQKYVKHFN